MSIKVTLDNIGSEIPPNVPDQTEEQDLFESHEPDTHKDHKDAEGYRLTLEAAKEQNNTLKLNNDTLRIQNSELHGLACHRINYSWAIFALTLLFLFATFLFLYLSSHVTYDVMCHKFIKNIEISDDVMMVLLGTNAVQVVGILFVVAKWLFPAANNKHLSNKQ
jgi:hypothetical protein